MTHRRSGAVFALFLLLAIPYAAQPQTKSAAAAAGYPSKPVRMIVGNAPGGGSDTIGRLIAQKLTERFRQSFFMADVQQVLAADGSDPAPGTPEQLRDAFEGGLNQAAQLVKDVGLKLE